MAMCNRNHRLDPFLVWRVSSSSSPDADVFPMDPDIFKDINSDHYKVWIYRYGNTIATGSTFLICFVGMAKAVWADILGHLGPRRLVEENFVPAELADKLKWDYDQVEQFSSCHGI